MYSIEIKAARHAFVVRGNLNEAKTELQELPKCFQGKRPMTIDLTGVGVHKWDEATKGMLCDLAKRSSVHFEVNPGDPVLYIALLLAESGKKTADFAYRA